MILRNKTKINKHQNTQTTHYPSTILITNNLTQHGQRNVPDELVAPPNPEAELVVARPTDPALLVPEPNTPDDPPLFQSPPDPGGAPSQLTDGLVPPPPSAESRLARAAYLSDADDVTVELCVVADSADGNPFGAAALLTGCEAVFIGCRRPADMPKEASFNEDDVM